MSTLCPCAAHVLGVTGLEGGSCLLAWVWLLKLNENKCGDGLGEQQMTLLQSLPLRWGFWLLVQAALCFLLSVGLLVHALCGYKHILNLPFHRYT